MADGLVTMTWEELDNIKAVAARTAAREVTKTLMTELDYLSHYHGKFLLEEMQEVRDFVARNREQ